MPCRGSEELGSYTGMMAQGFGYTMSSDDMAVHGPRAPAMTCIETGDLSVRRSVQALLTCLPAVASGAILDAGSEGGAVARWAAAQGLAATYCHLDLRACLTAGAGGPDGQFRIVHSDMLPSGPFGVVALDATAFDLAYAREAALEAAAVVAPQGVVLCAVPRGQSVNSWREHLAQVYADVQVFSTVLSARRPHCHPPQPPWVNWHLRWDSRELRFCGAAGVFSPGGLDPGTRAMLETMPVPGPGAHLLDLGCGTGAVAVIAAACWGCRVTAVDVNARALRLTAINARENGVAERVKIRASDGLGNVEAEFDLIVSNPPYHSDYSVAKSFLEGAAHALRLGGSLWLVAKRPVWYENRLRALFGGCHLVEQHGYTVLHAEKRRARPRQGPDSVATTRKHRKRIAQAARRKRQSGGSPRS
jgi:16S rRNA (guanine1207-N2)-methyltransferase